MARTTLPPSGDTPTELAEHLASGARLVEAFHLMPGVARAMRESACLLRKLVMGEYGHGVCTMKERAERAEQDAARYRWLVEQAYVWGRLAPIECTTQAEDVAIWMKGNVGMDKEGLDAAIDAAMKEGK